MNKENNFQIKYYNIPRNIRQNGNGGVATLINDNTKYNFITKKMKVVKIHIKIFEL